jgi:hypothetical protein
MHITGTPMQRNFLYFAATDGPDGMLGMVTALIVEAQ